MNAPREGRSTAGRPSVRPDLQSWAPLDAAFAAYRAGRSDAVVIMRTDVAEEERVPVHVFFRKVSEMGVVEQAALAGARGRVLDLGAGAGAHALPLVRSGLEVVAAEILSTARTALREGGVADVRSGGIETLEPGERFDTVLVLMNGLGLPGSLAGLDGFLSGLRTHLARGGQVLADSTDPTEWVGPGDSRYAGDVHMQLEFDGVAGPPFPFLFVDPVRLAAAARRVRMTAEIIASEPDGRYLARIRRHRAGDR